MSVQIKEVKTDKRNKRSKRIHASKSYYTSLLTGRTRTSKPSFVTVVEPESSSPYQESRDKGKDKYDEGNDDYNKAYDDEIYDG